MKKLLLFCVLLAMAGCAKVDSLFTWKFEVTNQTHLGITIVKTGNPDVMISHGETQTISYYDTMGGKDDVAGDLFQSDEIMRIVNSPHVTVKIKINDEYLPDIIFTRKYWDYTSNKYLSTYTLTITDELLEAIKNQNQP